MFYDFCAVLVVTLITTQLIMININDNDLYLLIKQSNVHALVDYVYEMDCIERKILILFAFTVSNRNLSLLFGGNNFIPS